MNSLVITILSFSNKIFQKLFLTIGIVITMILYFISIFSGIAAMQGICNTGYTFLNNLLIYFSSRCSCNKHMLTNATCSFTRSTQRGFPHLACEQEKSITWHQFLFAHRFFKWNLTNIYFNKISLNTDRTYYLRNLRFIWY